MCTIVKVSSLVDKDERPVKGVHLDDPKAVFLLRWYQEMDAKGNILKGYQQRGCQSYYLPLDNGGYPFEWTSNLQAICPVELNPLPNKNRTYKLQPNSKKMVVVGMKKEACPVRKLCKKMYVHRAVSYMMYVSCMRLFHVWPRHTPPRHLDTQPLELDMP